MCGASPLTTVITSSGPLIHRPYRSDDDLGPTELAYLEPLAPYDRSDGGYSEISPSSFIPNSTLVLLA